MSESSRSKLFDSRLWLAVVAFVILVVAGVLLRGRFGGGNGSDRLVYHTARRGDLAIVVVERGALESRDVTEIKCEVENLGFEQTGNTGTQILYVISNGSQVKAGDLLIELDNTALRDRIDAQIIGFEEAQAQQIQTEAKFQNQKSQNETALNEAKLNVKLAELQEKMYDDGEDGTYKIAVQEIDLKIQEAMDQIGDARTALVMSSTKRDGIKRLYKLGYRGRGDMDQTAYEYTQSEDTLVRATNRMANMVSTQRKLQQYEYPMEKLKLSAAVEKAERAVEQVKLDNASLLAQAEAARNAADRTMKKEEEKLKRYEAQLTKCKVFAPHAGMVAYEEDTFGDGIDKGTFVNQFQTVLTLPDLTTMQVKTAIHESMLPDVKRGLPATIKVDAIRGSVHRGTVESVAVLPLQLGLFQSQVKTYETIVNISDRVEGLTPGMTVTVEIKVDYLKDVVQIPVQAIVQIDEKSYCYTKGIGGPQRREVDLGRTNEKFIEISNGLTEGDVVVLNPMSILSQELQASEE